MAANSAGAKAGLMAACLAQKKADKTAVMLADSMAVLLAATKTVCLAGRWVAAMAACLVETKAE